MPQDKSQIQRKCGCCDTWTADGQHVPSGNTNPTTGRTPMDNWICTPCLNAASMLPPKTVHGYPARYFEPKRFAA